MEMNMGKVKQWLMNMAKLIFCLKHGAVHQDIWDRVNDPNYDDGFDFDESESEC